MEDYPVRAYSKKELALSYFPQSDNPHSAVNHLMQWIKRCRPLSEALEQQGYQKTSKWLSPREVSLIFRHLGPP